MINWFTTQYEQSVVYADVCNESISQQKNILNQNSNKKLEKLQHSVISIYIINRNRYIFSYYLQKAGLIVKKIY